MEEAAEPTDHVAMFRIGQVDVRHDDVGFDIETARIADRRRLGHNDQIGLRVDDCEQAFAHNGAEGVFIADEFSTPGKIKLTKSTIVGGETSAWVA